MTAARTSSSLVAALTRWRRRPKRSPPFNCGSSPAPSMELSLLPFTIYMDYFSDSFCGSPRSPWTWRRATATTRRPVKPPSSPASPRLPTVTLASIGLIRVEIGLLMYYFLTTQGDRSLFELEFPSSSTRRSTIPSSSSIHFSSIGRFNILYVVHDQLECIE